MSKLDNLHNVAISAKNLRVFRERYAKMTRPKFAEILGEDLEPHMKATTKDNLAWRVDCEFGATQGKFDLAACAKKNGLDAIHDTVHEMAKDEARHGKALQGMLNRYFAKEIALEKAAAKANKAAAAVSDAVTTAAEKISEIIKK